MAGVTLVGCARSRCCRTRSAATAPSLLTGAEEAAPRNVLMDDDLCTTLGAARRRPGPAEGPRKGAEVPEEGVSSGRPLAAPCHILSLFVPHNLAAIMR